MADVDRRVMPYFRDVQRACSERVPNVEVQAIFQHDNATGNQIAGVQVGMPIPIWNRNQGGIRQAQGESAAAQSGVSRVEFDLQQRLAAEYQRYANAQQQVRIYRESIMPDAKSALDLVGQGYKQGETNYLTMLTSQRTFIQTNLAYLQPLLDLQESKARIDGMLLNDSLAQDE